MMSDSTNRRKFLHGAGTIGTALLLAGCQSSSGEGSDSSSGEGSDYPSETISFVNHYSEGGGIDTNFRQFQPYWEEELGGTFQQTYQSGAGTRNGVTYIQNQDADCYTIGGVNTPAMPSTIAFDNNQEGRDPAFAIEDLEFIGTITSEYTIVRVRSDDDRFETIQDVVTYAEENPDDITFGTSGPTNRFALATIQFFEETGLDQRLVPYDGGGPVQTALMQEEVDVIFRGVYNSRGIEDETDCLAILAEENNWPEITNEAPSMGDALGGWSYDYGPTVGYQSYYLTAQAAEEYPDRYQTLVDTMQAASESDGYEEELLSIDELEPGKVDNRSPDETRQLWEAAVGTFEEFVPLFEEYVQGQ
jgi:tripartite-type tricarboxylate transporter receptor subunit TctC